MEAQTTHQVYTLLGKKKIFMKKYLFMKALIMLLGYKMSSHITFLGGCESAI